MNIKAETWGTWLRASERLRGSLELQWALNEGEPALVQQSYSREDLRRIDGSVVKLPAP